MNLGKIIRVSFFLILRETKERGKQWRKKKGKQEEREGRKEKKRKQRKKGKEQRKIEKEEEDGQQDGFVSALLR